MAKKKAKLSSLKTATHKGRKSKGMGSHYNPQTAMGVRATGLKADPRLVAQALGTISSTPHGPEPGHGGTMY